MKSWHAFKERFYVAKKYQPTLIAKLTHTHTHTHVHTWNTHAIANTR